ncbi:MAG: hypothetical protein R3F11_21055 [Verrucomicrobiales bacterium]
MRKVGTGRARRGCSDTDASWLPILAATFRLGGGNIAPWSFPRRQVLRRPMLGSAFLCAAPGAFAEARTTRALNK